VVLTQRCYFKAMFSIFCLALSFKTYGASPKTPGGHLEPILDGYYSAYPQTTPPSNIDADLVAKGEYLAKMGDCIACHTHVSAGTPAFAGGLPIATPFGTFYSPNITPDPDTGIGKWSEADFIRALKEGRSPEGKNYFPVFPYIYFANLTDEDAKALYAYFMSIPPVKQQNRTLPFPFNLSFTRTTLWGWNLLFFYPNSRVVNDPSKSDVWNRGHYIVDSLGHCGMCHTPLNPLGAPRNKLYLTGTFVDGYWAPNITSHGLHSANRYQVAQVFAEGELLNQAGPVAGPMAEVNHNSLSYLTDDDRAAIATYLKTVDMTTHFDGSSAQPTLKRGKQVYVHACVLCHQDGQMSAPIIGDSSNWTNRLKASGLTGLYRHVINGFNSMPIRGACVTCSDNDIIAAVDYVLDKSLTRSDMMEVKSRGLDKFPASGKDVYDENCSLCHDSGQFGAPKIGDAVVWQSLLKHNVDGLVESVINGKTHAKNGTCKSCSTGEILDAVKYILSQSVPEQNYSLW
jgi:cytochrome c5